MGRRFKGVFHLGTERLMRFAPGEERVSGDTETIEGLDNPRLDALAPDDVGALRQTDSGSASPIRWTRSSRGSRARCSGSGINFGVREIRRVSSTGAAQRVRRFAEAEPAEPVQLSNRSSDMTRHWTASRSPRGRCRYWREAPARRARDEIGNAYVHGERTLRPRTVAGDIIIHPGR
jgi:hypothetical protein